MWDSRTRYCAAGFISKVQHVRIRLEFKSDFRDLESKGWDMVEKQGFLLLFEISMLK